MLQAAVDRHGDLISLSLIQNPPMDSMEELREERRKAVGQRIAHLREQAGLSQPGLATLAGIKQPSLCAIETGETKEITARVLIALCRALGTTVEYIWDGAESDEDGAEQEAQLVAIYRQLQAPGRMAVMQSAKAVLAAMPPEPPTPTSEEVARFEELRKRKVKPKQRRRSA